MTLFLRLTVGLYFAWMLLNDQGLFGMDIMYLTSFLFYLRFQISCLGDWDFPQCLVIIVSEQLLLSHGIWCVNRFSKITAFGELLINSYGARRAVSQQLRS
jgi:hypothetical protein